MKRIILAAVLMGASACQLLPAEVNGKVIHHYTFVGGGYGFLHDVGDELNAHGVFANASFEEHNVVMTFGGAYFWGDDDLGIDADVTLWDLNASVGYVVRLAENHLNIIPRFGAAYAEAAVDVPDFGTERADAWSIAPGATVSYALNNRIAVAGSYAYVYNLEVEEGNHAFSVGPKFAIFERVGVGVSATFDDEEGFTGVFAGVELHF
jgi:hypothetical protein